MRVTWTIKTVYEIPQMDLLWIHTVTFDPAKQGRAIQVRDKYNAAAYPESTRDKCDVK